jgi:riboflavin biosynthesis pyrimidine reductase
MKKSRLAPLQTLLEAREGAALPLPPRLARLYGSLRMPPRAHVFSNFVTSLDGVVSLAAKGHASGADISGFNAQDRMVMGLLRAVADVVIVGSGTLGADRRHLWTAEEICPELAGEFGKLRTALGKHAPPLNVVVSRSAALDLSLPIFSSGRIPTLIITTFAGIARLRKAPPTVAVAALRPRAGGKGASLSARAIVDAVRKVHPGRWILVEGGPRLLGDFYAEGLIREQFLTLAPQIAGRDAGDRRPSLVMGKSFAPRHPLWGRLADLRRGDSHLFLRYAFTPPARRK